MWLKVTLLLLIAWAALRPFLSMAVGYNDSPCGGAGIDRAHGARRGGEPVVCIARRRKPYLIRLTLI